MISRDEWLAALNDASLGFEDENATALTVREFCEMFHCCKESGVKKLTALVAAGKAQRVSKSWRGGGGRIQRASAYRLVTD